MSDAVCCANRAGNTTRLTAATATTTTAIATRTLQSRTLATEPKRAPRCRANDAIDR
jgi:hypothetical protein